MDYTQSNSFVTDAGTAQRMHLAGQAVPTAVSDNDMNMLVWELMEIQKAGGQVAAPFDKATPATYQKLLTALRAAGVFQTTAVGDNTTKAATMAALLAAPTTAAIDATGADNSTRAASTGWVRNAMANIATAAGFVAVLAANGYLKLPSWLGGVIFQWGGGTNAAANTTATFFYPITFPTAAYVAFVQSNSALGPIKTGVVTALGLSNLGWQTESATTQNHFFFLIGK